MPFEHWVWERDLLFYEVLAKVAKQSWPLPAPRDRYSTIRHAQANQT